MCLTQIVSHVTQSDLCNRGVTHIICIAGARFCKMCPLWIVLPNCSAVSLQIPASEACSLLSLRKTATTFRAKCHKLLHYLASTLEIRT